MDEFPSILIGSLSEGITFAIHGRTHADCSDYWDGNWLSTKVDVAAGRFRARIHDCTRAEEFAAFHEQIARMHETLGGTAQFVTLEGWVQLDMTIDSTGHIRCEGFLMDQPGIGNRLSFHLDIDQSYLPSMIQSLGDICRKYPVIGK